MADEDEITYAEARDEMRNELQNFIIELEQSEQGYRRDTAPRVRDFARAIDQTLNLALKIEDLQLQQKYINDAAQDMKNFYTFFQVKEFWHDYYEIKEQIEMYKRKWQKNFKSSGDQILKKTTENQDKSLPTQEYMDDQKKQLGEQMRAEHDKFQAELEEKRRPRKAATKIQAIYRGNKVREKLKKENKAATKVQSLYRDYVGRIKTAHAKQMNDMVADYNARTLMSPEEREQKDKELLNKIKSQLTEFSDKDFSSTQKFARAVRNPRRTLKSWSDKVNEAAKYAARRVSGMGRGE